jgi:hypothetical protein
MKKHLFTMGSGDKNFCRNIHIADSIKGPSFLPPHLSLVGLGFDLRALHLQSYHLSYTSSPFCSGYFGYGVLQTIFRAGLILLISASQVARITGVNHRCLAKGLFLEQGEKKTLNKSHHCMGTKLILLFVSE